MPSRLPSAMALMIASKANRLAIAALIAAVGDDPLRPELLQTPSRIERTLKDVFYGYAPLKPDFAKSFDVSDIKVNFVCIRNVFFSSNCEHHMLPFFGKADFVYSPSDSIIGLSKVVNILNYFSARLQTQERLGYQVFDCLKRLLRPRSLVVKLTCKHVCMMARGVKSVCSTASTVVSCGEYNISKVVASRIDSLLADSE
ncbi:MAG: GTP cyclohydrolase I [Candidatus Hodgkinia cicadicola]